MERNRTGDAVEFDTWFYEERTKRKLSQSALERMTGISQSTWSAVEKGQQPPTARILAALAPAFGLKRNDLMQRWGFIDSPYEMSPEMTGLVEVLDRKLEAIDDPKVKELAITRLKHDIAALTDMVESLSEFIESLPTKDG